MLSIHEYYPNIIVQYENNIPNGSILFKEITGLGMYGPTCHFGLYFRNNKESFVIDWDSNRRYPCIKRTFKEFSNDKNNNNKIYRVIEEDNMIKLNNKDIKIRSANSVLERASFFINKDYYYDVAFANCEQFVIRCKSISYKNVDMTIPSHIRFENINNLSKEEIDKWTVDSYQSKNVLQLLHPVMNLADIFIKAFSK